MNRIQRDPRKMMDYALNPGGTHIQQVADALQNHGDQTQSVVGMLQQLQKTAGKSPGGLTAAIKKQLPELMAAKGQANGSLADVLRAAAGPPGEDGVPNGLADALGTHNDHADALGAAIDAHGGTVGASNAIGKLAPGGLGHPLLDALQQHATNTLGLKNAVAGVAPPSGRGGIAGNLMNSAPNGLAELAPLLNAKAEASGHMASVLHGLGGTEAPAPPAIDAVHGIGTGEPGGLSARPGGAVGKALGIANRGGLSTPPTKTALFGSAAGIPSSVSAELDAPAGEGLKSGGAVGKALGISSAAPSGLGGMLGQARKSAGVATRLLDEHSSSGASSGLADA